MNSVKTANLRFKEDKNVESVPTRYKCNICFIKIYNFDDSGEKLFMKWQLQEFPFYYKISVNIARLCNHRNKMLLLPE